MSLEQALAANTAALEVLAQYLSRLDHIVPLGAIEAPKRAPTPAQAAPAPIPPTVAASAVPAPKVETSAPVLTYDDVKKVFFDYMNTKGVPAGQKFLTDRGLSHLTGIKDKPEQFAVLRDELVALTTAA